MKADGIQTIFDDIWMILLRKDELESITELVYHVRKGYKKREKIVSVFGRRYSFDV